MNVAWEVVSKMESDIFYLEFIEYGHQEKIKGTPRGTYRRVE
jgi:hypothetical protein